MHGGRPTVIMPVEFPLIRDYIDAVMKRARYEDLSDDGISYGEIPDCNGVYATSATLEECTILLEEVLE